MQIQKRKKMSLLNQLAFSFLTLVFGVLLFSGETHAARLFLSPTSQEFTNECNSTVNILIDTEGIDTNAADAVINYNPNEVDIIDQDNSQPGIQIRNGNTYAVYAGNIADPAQGKIFLTAFNVFGAYNSNGTPGTYGSIILQGKPGVTSTDLTFDFTPGETRDSNVADLVSDDILTSVGNGSYTFTVGFCGSDTVPPNVINRDPAPDSKNNPLDTNITFNITDNASGVDIDTLEVDVDGVIYENGDPEFLFTGTPLNYAITIDPVSDFIQDTPVFVKIDADDIVGNTMNTVSYSFNHPTPDTRPPFVVNPSPGPGTTGVPLSSDVSFRIRDDISGVNIDTLNVKIDNVNYSENSPNLTFTGDPNNYFVVIDPLEDFPDETQITVEIDATDFVGNVMNTFVFTFNQTIVDNTPPRVRSTTPRNNARQVPLDSNVSFVITDNLKGVDLDSVSVDVNGKLYNRNSPEVTVSGDTLRYEFTINPLINFPAETRIPVAIDAIDLVGNRMNTFRFAFNEPAVCGDFLVEIEFGEECEPPGVGLCNENCKISDVPICGNGIIEEGEECELPNEAGCNAFCQEIPALEVTECIEISENIDSDGDGLPDVLEFHFQTSRKSQDSDGDGITDIEEILDYGSDPNDPTPIVFGSRIVNWKNGDKTGSKQLVVRGISFANQRVKVNLLDENDVVFPLASGNVNEENKFVVVGEHDLPEGKYFLQAESFDEENELLDRSDRVQIEISYQDGIPAPRVESISGQSVAYPTIDSLDIIVNEQRPTVYGSTVQNSQVFVTFQSLITSATVISDSLEGDFQVTSAKPLEFGDHKVTVYAVTPDGITSDAVIVPFEIQPSDSFLGQFDWMYVFIFISLIVFSIAEFKKWKRRKDEEKENKDAEGEDV